MTAKKSAKASKKPKMGRPSKFSAIKLPQLKILVEMGATNHEICAFFNLSERTFQRYLVDDADFCQTLKEWKNFANARVERSLYQRACGYSHESEEIFCAFGKVTRVKTVKHYAPDPLSCAIWLKNRKPDEWRDKPPDPEDKELQNAELVFNSVPKNGKGAEQFKRFFDN